MQDERQEREHRRQGRRAGRILGKLHSPGTRAITNSPALDPRNNPLPDGSAGDGDRTWRMVMRLPARALTACAALAFAALIVAGASYAPSHAQSPAYPSHPVRIIVPFAPG